MSDVFLEMDKTKEQTLHNCLFYSWGGCITRDYSTYPSAYGARCESVNEFFSRDKDGKLEPNCPTCNCYIEWEAEYSGDRRRSWLSDAIIVPKLPEWIETDEEMQELMHGFDKCRVPFKRVKASLWKRFAEIEIFTEYHG